MNEFQRYLELHEIDPIRLSVEAQVRYQTVYNATKGDALMPESAEKIKEALLRLTGIPYVGTVAKRFFAIERLKPGVEQRRRCQPDR